MALVFTKDISETQWLTSENNRIIEFSDDDGSREPLFCDIDITGIETIRIFPLPDQSFWFNFKDYFSSLLSSYTDDIDYSGLDDTDIQTYILDHSHVVWNNDIDITVTFDDDATESVTRTPFVTLAVEQEEKFRQGETIASSDEFILSPFKLGTSNRYHLRYWNGYPFDFCYSRGISTNTTTQNITNNTNAVSTPDFDLLNDCHRIVISDGDTTQTLEDFVSFTDGHNELELTTSLFIDLWKMDSDCGVYLKWLNNYGGWSYWLFNEQHERSNRSRNKGVLNSDNYNLGGTNSPYRSLGVDMEDKLRAVAEGLTHDDINVLKGIIRSPKIYWFLGDRFTTNDADKWIEVTIDNTSIVERDFRNNVPNVDIALNLPKLHTISL